MSSGQHFNHTTARQECLDGACENAYKSARFVHGWPYVAVAMIALGGMSRLLHDK